MSDGKDVFSIGIENLSFAIYKKEKKAMTVLKDLVNFLGDKNDSVFFSRG